MDKLDLLVVCAAAPSDIERTNEILDLVFTSLSFDQKTAILLVDQGIRQLDAMNQEKSIASQREMLDGFGLEGVYIENLHTTDANQDTNAIAERLPNDELSELMRQSRRVIHL